MTELFPIVPVPPWVKNCSQPIAARNVLDYLVAALDSRDGHGRIFEIGGPEVMLYSALMLEYARLRGLKRRMLMFPYIPLWFMAFGVGLTSPVPRRIAYALIDGLRSDSRVQDPSVRSVFPQVELVPFAQAVEESLAQLHPDTVQPVWNDERRASVNLRHEGFFISHHRLYVAAEPKKVFPIIAGLGRNGDWLFARPLWALRRWIDSFFQKQEPAPAIPGDTPQPGDRVDTYRVDSVTPGARLLLRSTLKAPGEGWMEWTVKASTHGGTTLTQTGYFAPRGLPGFLYWYLLAPAHEWVFRGLSRAIARRAER